MQEKSCFSNSKNSEKLPHYRKFIVAYYAKSLNILSHSEFSQNFCNNDKLSVLKQQHADLQNKHGKGHPWHFIEKKDSKHYSK